MYEKVKDIEHEFVKLYKANPNGDYKKRSIFWHLSYWRHLEFRHCLDVMHIEKNMCDTVVGTLLNIPVKIKDGLKVRKDMTEMGRIELALKEIGKRIYLPPAFYTLLKTKKTHFCESLHGLKVPTGY